MKITIERGRRLTACTKGALYLNSMYKLCDTREPPLKNAIPEGTYFVELQPRSDGKLVPHLLLVDKYPVSSITDHNRHIPCCGSIQIGVGSTAFPLDEGQHFMGIIVRAMLQAELRGEPVVLTIR